MYIAREAEPAFRRLLSQYKVVLVTGSRQVGKTTMIRHCLGDSYGYVTLDDPVALDQAKTDPALFFQDHPLPVIIDEVQYAPELFRYVKLLVDASDDRGQVVLTGSQSYHLMQGVSESLAGRVGILELPGISLREELGTAGRGAYVPGKSELASVDQPDDLWARIWRGSMPEVVTGRIEWATYYANYEKTYLERDVRDLINVRDMSAFYRFLVATAARTGQLLNMSDIANDAGISAKTVDRWLSVLEASGVILKLRPYFPNASSRVSKTPKIHFMDTGLAAHLLGWVTPEVLSRGAMAGAMFESYVVGEIAKAHMNSGRGTEGLYFYRDSRKREIDLLVMDGRTAHPIEVKAGASPAAGDVKNFDVLDSTKGIEVGEGAVVCRASQVYSITRNVKATPIWKV